MKGRPNSGSRILLRGLLGSWLVHKATCPSEGDLARSAVVFAPHPDDETLGCGGTIAMKKQAGADVSIVFMTDGRRSNRHLMPEEQIKAIRRDEALAATGALGVSQDRVIFLDFENGKLSQHREAARRRVVEILDDGPQEVFVPYRGEPPLASDEHRLTNQIVLSALDRCRRRRLVYEYPVWLWDSWPWVPIAGQGLARKFRFMLRSARSSLALFLRFHCSVDIRSVLDLKRAALSCHRSQMTRLVADPRWKTLPQMGDGEFLECFFGGYETFWRHQLPKG